MIRLVTIDCWDTVLQNNPAWDYDLIDIALPAFRAKNASIDRQALVSAFNAERDHFYRILQDEKVTLILGTRLKTFASYAQVQLSEPELVRLETAFENAIFDPLPELFPGVREFLTNIKQLNIKTCVICNTGWFSSRAINGAFERCDLAQFFDFYAYSDVVGSAKPSPKIFEFALSAAGCRPEEAVHIGDKWSTDIVGALGAGLTAIHFHANANACTNKAVSCASNYKEIWTALSSYLAHPNAPDVTKNANSP